MTMTMTIRLEGKLFFTQKSLPDPSVEASGDPLEFLKTPKTLR